MSIVITTFVPEGIVLAADSRVTMNWPSVIEGKPNINFTQVSDTSHKVFLINQRIGLATHGDACIEGVPMASFINQFIDQRVLPTDEVDVVAKKVLEYFRNLESDLSTFFYVVGYKKVADQSEQHIYLVDIKGNQQTRTNHGTEGTFFGANWGGEIEVISRLVRAVKMSQGDDWVEVDQVEVPWSYMTLQDAIDFSTFAVRTTIESLRFQQKIQTVGGPVDVLVLRPREDGLWVARKELHP